MKSDCDKYKKIVLLQEVSRYADAEPVDNKKGMVTLMIKAVIFDMDGVLIDTEKYYYAAWQQAFHEFGFTSFSGEDALALRSFDARQASVALKEKFGEELDYYEIRERRRTLVENLIKEQGIQLKPGVKEILARLKEQNIKRAVATATAFDITKERLESLGIFDDFDEVVSAKQVEHGKPSPDVYLFACEKIGEKPEECIAVEDSPNGILSAYRAGCKPVMVPDLTQPDEELKQYLYDCVETVADLKI